jgi:hypothetical protein
MGLRKAIVDPCEQCGATDWTEPSFAQKVGHWLRLGGPLSAAGPRRCRRCGNEILGLGYGPRMLSARLGGGRVGRNAGPVRVLLAPVNLVRALRQGRTMYPSPWIYIAAGLIGLIAGIILQLTLDVPWWLVAASAVVFVWLLFLSSAVLNMRNVAGSFLHLTAPRMAIRISERKADDALRSTDLPLYGLADWRGPRFVGGHGTDGRRVSSWTLAHGDPFDEGSPDVRVEVKRSEHPPALMARQIFEEFHHGSRRPPEGLSPDEFHTWVLQMHREIRTASDPTWATVSLKIDGAAVPFSHLAHGEHWVAWAAVGEPLIVVHAARMPVDDVALARVTDVEPYIEGGRLLRERRHPSDLG